MENYNLCNLLDYDPLNKNMRKKLDGEAIIRQVEQDPAATLQMYPFTHTGRCYPVEQAIKLGAPADVVDALYHPILVRLSIKTLDLAIQYRASLDVVSLILQKRPAEVRETTNTGHIALSLACMNKAPLEVISLLLEHWPGAARERGVLGGDTPLHFACRHGASFEVVSLLIDSWPGAVRSRNCVDDTPLHLACYAASYHGAPMETIRLLIERWPEVVVERNVFGTTFMDSIPVQEGDLPDEIFDIITNVSYLCDNYIEDSSLTEVMKKFVGMEWWKGVLMLLDRHPMFTQTIALHASAMADYLSTVGRCCKLTTMWEVIRNNQELLSDV